MLGYGKVTDVIRKVRKDLKRGTDYDLGEDIYESTGIENRKGCGSPKE